MAKKSYIKKVAHRSDKWIAQWQAPPSTFIYTKVFDTEEQALEYLNSLES